MPVGHSDGWGLALESPLIKPKVFVVQKADPHVLFLLVKLNFLWFKLIKVHNGLSFGIWSFHNNTSRGHSVLQVVNIEGRMPWISEERLIMLQAVTTKSQVLGLFLFYFMHCIVGDEEHFWRQLHYLEHLGIHVYCSAIHTWKMGYFEVLLLDVVLCQLQSCKKHFLLLIWDAFHPAHHRPHISPANLPELLLLIWIYWLNIFLCPDVFPWKIRYSLVLLLSIFYDDAEEHFPENEKLLQDNCLLGLPDYLFHTSAGQVNQEKGSGAQHQGHLLGQHACPHYRRAELCGEEGLALSTDMVQPSRLAEEQKGLVLGGEQPSYLLYLHWHLLGLFIFQNNIFFKLFLIFMFLNAVHWSGFVLSRLHFRASEY